VSIPVFVGSLVRCQYRFLLEVFHVVINVFVGGFARSHLEQSKKNNFEKIHSARSPTKTGNDTV
jgi:hypothetical protein